MFAPQCLEDLQHWIEVDARVALRIVRLVAECVRMPFSGTGQPEPLKHQLRGLWSRRITGEHRLVYRVSDAEVEFIQARYHYD